ncbi:MAG: hypothetical protein Q8R00_03895 [Candidatus Nanoarchaeia archaeon]|nr:hypothetical protein [Candidatus Nanoarchaeia archaeon]
MVNSSRQIKLKSEVVEQLDNFKIIESETYNEVVSRLIEDKLELNQETKDLLNERINALKKGKTKLLTSEQIIAEMK